MKYVVLSFDDGRLDTYINAIPVMKKFGLTATINIVTDFVEDPLQYTKFDSADNKAMTIQMVQDMSSHGFEIACHSHTHCNDVPDILTGINHLKEWGIPTEKIGFASPYSALCESNFKPIEELIQNKVLSYVRSGVQVRREGYLYSLIYLLQDLFKSKFLFSKLNKKNCGVVSHVPKYFVGVSVSAKTTLDQIKYLIDTIPDGHYVILILHSIISSGDRGYGADKWYWDIRDFESLCRYLSGDKSIKVITNMELREGKL